MMTRSVFFSSFSLLLDKASPLTAARTMISAWTQEGGVTKVDDVSRGEGDKMK